MHKKLKSFHKQFTSLKNVAPRTKDNENKKKEVLNNAEDLYNELYYIYKDKYIEKENNLNKKNFKNLITKNLDLLIFTTNLKMKKLVNQVD